MGCSSSSPRRQKPAQKGGLAYIKIRVVDNTTNARVQALWYQGRCEYSITRLTGENVYIIIRCRLRLALVRLI